MAKSRTNEKQKGREIPAFLVSYDVLLNHFFFDFFGAGAADAA
jgi:hypothetical protein